MHKYDDPGFTSNRRMNIPDTQQQDYIDQQVDRIEGSDHNDTQGNAQNVNQLFVITPMVKMLGVLVVVMVVVVVGALGAGRYYQAELRVDADHKEGLTSVVHVAGIGTQTRQALIYGEQFQQFNHQQNSQFNQFVVHDRQTVNQQQPEQYKSSRNIKLGVVQQGVLQRSVLQRSVLQQQKSMDSQIQQPKLLQEQLKPQQVKSDSESLKKQEIVLDFLNEIEQTQYIQGQSNPQDRLKDKVGEVNINNLIQEIIESESEAESTPKPESEAESRPTPESKSVSQKQQNIAQKPRQQPIKLTLQLQAPQQIQNPQQVSNLNTTPSPTNPSQPQNPQVSQQPPTQAPLPQNAISLEPTNEPSPNFIPSVPSKQKLIFIKQRTNQVHPSFTMRQIQLPIDLMQQVNGNIIYQTVNNQAKAYQSSSISSQEGNLNTQLTVKEDKKALQFMQKSEEKQTEQSPQQKALILNILQFERNHYKSKYLHRITNPNLEEKYMINKPIKETKKSGMGQTSMNNQQANIQKQLPFCILVPSFNNAKKLLYKRSINSILQQQYKNYHIVYIDDASEDNTTFAVIDELMTRFPEQNQEIRDKILNDPNFILSFQKRKGFDLEFNQIKWKFIVNKKKKLAMRNIHEGITNFCEDNEIAIILDGDDAFIGTQALKILNRAYIQTESLYIFTGYVQKKHKQLDKTYQFPKDFKKILQTIKENDRISRNYFVDKQERYKPLDEMTQREVDQLATYEIGWTGRKVNMEMMRKKELRKQMWLPATHLLSFYVSLFKKIEVYYFRDENNLYWPYAYDCAITFSLAELAYTRTFFLKELLYEYRADTGINDSARDWWWHMDKNRRKPPIDLLDHEQMKDMVDKVLSQ